MKKAVIYTLTFMLIQLATSAIVQGIMSLVAGETVPLTATMFIVIDLIFSVVAIGLFVYLKWAEVSRSYVRSRPWAALCWCALAAVGALIPSVWLQELMPELPNVMEAEFDMIMKDRWGYLAIGLLAPLAEELVFRGAVLRALLNWTRGYGWRHWQWAAIGISAIIFAAVHGNPAQMPHAFLIGLLLGWLYYRTDSVVPGVVYHWVNNSIAYVMYNLYPDPSLKLADLLGGQRQVVQAVAFSLLILLPALYQLSLRLRKAS
ncbi:MAG: CPBP family intramembrane metalloprotease [Prevotella sp.]|nr:CPBP family intramembrane metalloprotease [Prevotella sp.]